MTRSQNPDNLQNRPAWKLFVRLFFWLTLLPAGSWLIVSSFIDPAHRNFLFFWRFLITLALFGLLFHFRVFRAVHEGLHAIAAHWSAVPPSFITARDTYVFVKITDKKSWYKITLYPLLFPIAVFLLFIPWNWEIGLYLACILAAGSCQDLANLVMVSRTPGNWVSDTAEGLFVYDTPPPVS